MKTKWTACALIVAPWEPDKDHGYVYCCQSNRGYICDFQIKNREKDPYRCFHQRMSNAGYEVCISSECQAATRENALMALEKTRGNNG